MKAWVERTLQSRNFFWLNAISIAGSVAGMGMNYLYNVLAARALPLGEYGVLGVIVGVWTVATIPVGSLTNVLARAMSKLEGRPRRMNFILRKYVRKMGLWAGAGALALAAGALAAGQPVWAILLAGLPFSFMTGVMSGYLQAGERILEMTIASTGAILLKLIGLGVFLGLGWGLGGAVGALSAASLAGFLLLFSYLWPRTAEVEGHEISVRGAVGWLMLTQLAMAVMGYLDLFFVRHLISDAAAGLYNVAEITAKILPSLASAVAVVLYPKIAKLRHGQVGGPGVQLLGGSMALLVPVFVGFQLLAAPFMLTFFGDKFAGSVEPFRILSGTMLLMAWSALMANFLWARGVERPVMAAYAAGVALEAGLLWTTLPQGGLSGAAGASAAAAMALALMLGAAVWRQLGQERAAARGILKARRGR